MLQQKSNQNKQIWECGADELKAIGFIFPNSAAAKDMKLVGSGLFGERY